MRELMKYLEARDIRISLENGKVEVRGANKGLIQDSIKNNNYLKLALLS